MRFGRFGSLRSRLTAAVMVPLLALVLVFGGITCWVIHTQTTVTSDRVLIGSVRILGQAIDTDRALRPKLFPLAVHLLNRRSQSMPYYSIYRGQTLVAGTAGLMPPDRYPVGTVGPDDSLPAIFPEKGHATLSGAWPTLQPAYLRYGILNGQPVRIATEMVRPHGDPRPLVIQVADLINDRQRYEETKYLQVISGGILIAMFAVLLFYWAISVGLQPFSALTNQVEAARDDPPLHFRLTLDDDAPDEAVTLAGAFNGLMARTEKAVDSLRQFTSNASHQMRTPLSIVRVHMDVLTRFGADSRQGRAAITDIGEAILSLERLLLQLISLARTEEQPVDPDASFDLAETVTTVVCERVAQIVDDDPEVSVECADDRLLAHGHPIMAAELIGNLFDNAVRYNRPGGSVVVRLSRQDGKARVEIEDDGPGIPLGERDKVWQRFYRATTSLGRGGSGLGLPIVRALADRMGVDIHLAEGVGGRGLRATVDFRAEIKPEPIAA